MAVKSILAGRRGLAHPDDRDGRHGDDERRFVDDHSDLQVDGFVRRPLRVAAGPVEAVVERTVAAREQVAPSGSRAAHGVAAVRYSKTGRPPRANGLFSGGSNSQADTNAMRLRDRDRPDVRTEVSTDVWLDRVQPGADAHFRRKPRTECGVDPRGRPNIRACLLRA